MIFVLVLVSINYLTLVLNYYIKKQNFPVFSTETEITTSNVKYVKTQISKAIDNKHSSVI